MDHESMQSIATTHACEMLQIAANLLSHATRQPVIIAVLGY